MYLACQSATEPAAGHPSSGAEHTWQDVLLVASWLKMTQTEPSVSAQLKPEESQAAMELTSTFPMNSVQTSWFWWTDGAIRSLHLEKFANWHKPRS
jgi:hypothetical protein